MAGGKRKTGVTTWVIIGLLVFALGGFGIGNFGGTVRSIGAVGETEVPVEDYMLALRNELRAQRVENGRAPSLSSPEGQALTAAVRARLLSAAALEGEAARLGLSIGDEAVRREVLQTPAFQGPNGQFDREGYTFTLRQNGLNEAEFEESIRVEAATNLTTAALLAGMRAPETMVDVVASYAGERRDIDWLRLDQSALTAPLPAPTEAELQAQYESTPEAYTEPEKRRVTYAVLTPEAVVADIEVDEDALRALYEDRSAEFNRPERRLVERLVFPDQAAAEAARAAFDEGNTTFEALVRGRGLTLQDIDLGDVTRAELDEAGEAIFALEEPGVVGPIETSLGPALFRMNAILQAQSTPFEEVRDDLTDELALDRARRSIDDLRDEIDNLLVGGATVEEVADETAMELGTLDVGPDTSEGIAGYAAFRDAVATIGLNDFPELLELEDGGLFTLRLDEVLEPALLPFEDVRERVEQDWAQAETEARLNDLAEEIAAAEAAGTSLADQGYSPETHQNLARESFLDGSPRGMIAAAFDLDEGESVVLVDDGTAHLVILRAITPEDPTEPDAEAVRNAISQLAAQGLSQDVAVLFVQAIEAEAGISLNQTAINAAHTQFP